jgi:hypothetical protein
LPVCFFFLCLFVSVCVCLFGCLFVFSFSHLLR